MIKKSLPVVALYGGSFDPPHIGHEKVVKRAIETLDADYVVVVPAWRNPFKGDTLASAQQRYKWIRTIFEKNQKVRVEPFEIERGYAVPTIETYNALKHRYDIRYLLIGADNLRSIRDWQSFDELNEKVTWVIVTRSGYEIASNIPLRAYRILKLHCDISSSEIRNGVFKGKINKQIANEVETLLKQRNVKREQNTQ